MKKHTFKSVCGKIKFRSHKLLTFYLALMALSLSDVSANGIVPKASVYEAEIKLQSKPSEKTVKEVIKEIEQQTNFLFIYNDEVNLSQRVTLATSNQTLDRILADLSNKTGLVYTIEDENILLYPRREEVAQQSNRNLKIEGVVKDIHNDPLIGAQLTIKGTTVGTITDIDGNFTLTAKSGDVLEVSYIGYMNKSIKVHKSDKLTIVLEEDIKILDEVVVVGFGTQKKVNVTGAVGTVSSKEIENRPVNNISQALQGVVPGLNLSVNSDGGMIDNKMSVNIRGTGTIGTGSTASPLILIDGIEGDMNTLAPQDIENISVLKDASSAAVYGARAAFGVILITTKSGKEEKISISYSNSFRFSKPVTLPEMLPADKFARYFNRAATNSGNTPVFTDETLALIDKTMTNNWTQEEIESGLHLGTSPTADGKKWRVWGEGHANTDWFKEFYKSHSSSQEHSLRVSGGSRKVIYSLSGSFLGVDGLIRHGSDELQRFNISGKFQVNINKYVSLNFNTRWVREEFDKPYYLSGLSYHNLARRWPTVAVKDPYGNYIEQSQVANMKDGGKSKSEKDWLTNYLQLKIEPIKDWNIYLEGSHRSENFFSHSHLLSIYGHYTDNQPYPYSIDGDTAAGLSRASEGANKNNFYVFNGFTDYFKQFDNHYFKVMAGFNAELMKTRNLNGSAENLITPTLPTINTATDNMKTSGGYSEWSSAGFFGRINYNYKERYLFEANARYDGVSRFVGNERWGFFPSFSLGWNLANESFYKEKFGGFAKAVHTLKLRGSWGDLGNMNTDNWYPFYQTLPYSKQSSSWLLDGKKPNVASAPGLVSSMLTWERVRQWNVGLDVAAFNNRLTGSFDYFTRTTLDMIGPAPEMPSILGTGVPRINNCDMKSYGWELEIGWRDQVQDLSYGIKLVLSDSEQKITRYPNDTKNLGEYYSGMKLGDIWGYVTKGIAQSQEEIDQHLVNNKPTWGSNWAAGDIMYIDQDGDGIISGGENTLANPGDRRIIGNSTPRYRYGISLDAAYKGFDLSLFFQGIGKRDYNLGGSYFWGATGVGGVWQSVGFKEHWDFWRPEGDPLGANTNAYFPRVAFEGGKNAYTQTRYLQDASYIRLKNIQLGYSLPKAIIRKLNLNRVRIYISGDNLWTHSKLSDAFDPEGLGGGWGSGKTYPLQKTISVGLNVNF